MMVDFLLQVGQVVVSGLFSVFAFWAVQCVSSMFRRPSSGTNLSISCVSLEVMLFGTLQYSPYIYV